MQKKKLLIGGKLPHLIFSVNCSLPLSHHLRCIRVIQQCLNKVILLSCLCSCARVLDGIDEFCTAHFLGWVMKALLVRHYGILWTISLMWEFTEMIFSHLLPNFAVSYALCTLYNVQCTVKNQPTHQHAC